MTEKNPTISQDNTSTESYDDIPTVKTPNSLKKDYMQLFKNTIDIFSSISHIITWKIITIILLITFYQPIYKITSALAKKIENSSEFSLGSFSFKAVQQAKIMGNPELAQTIGNLSQDAIIWLLKLEGTSYNMIMTHTEVNKEKSYSLHEDFHVFKELESKNLLFSQGGKINIFEKYFQTLNPIDGKIQKKNLQANEIDHLDLSLVTLTPQGEQVYKVLLSTIREVILE